MILKKLKNYFIDRDQNDETKKLILIIVDQARDRDLIYKTLKKRSYKLISVNEQDEGYKKILEYKPNLIIIGCNLSNEAVLFVKLKESSETKNIPILAVTNPRDDSKTVKYIQIADDYIAKPINEKELVSQVESLII